MNIVGGTDAMAGPRWRANLPSGTMSADFRHFFANFAVVPSSPREIA